MNVLVSDVDVHRGFGWLRGCLGAALAVAALWSGSAWPQGGSCSVADYFSQSSCEGAGMCDSVMSPAAGGGAFTGEAACEAESHCTLGPLDVWSRGNCEALGEGCSTGDYASEASCVTDRGSCSVGTWASETGCERDHGSCSVGTWASETSCVRDHGSCSDGRSASEGTCGRRGGTWTANVGVWTPNVGVWTPNVGVWGGGRWVENMWERGVWTEGTGSPEGCGGIYYFAYGGLLHRQRCDDGVSTSRTACMSGDLGSLWYADAERVCVGQDISFPGILTGDGGLSAEELQRLRRLIDELRGGATPGSQGFQTPADLQALLTRGGLEGLVNDIVGRSCIGGLGNLLSSNGIFWEHLEPIGGWFLRPANAFFGGFSVAALIPVLKQILGTDLEQLVQLVRQLCHQAGIEASSQGAAVTNAGILAAVQTSPVVMRAVDSIVSGSAVEQLMSRQSGRVAYSGGVSLGIQQLRAQLDETTMGLVVQQARIFGDETLGEFAEGEDVTVTDADAAAQSDYYVTGEKDFDGMQEWFRSQVTDEMGEEIVTVNLQEAAGIEGAPSGAGGAQGAVASCIAAYPNPVGEAADGFAGATRKLRARATYGLRRAPIMVYMCGLVPDEVTVTELCLGDATVGTKWLEAGLEICMYGPRASASWAIVWGAVKLAVLFVFGWLSISLWLPRGLRGSAA